MLDPSFRGGVVLFAPQLMVMQMLVARYSSNGNSETEKAKERISGRVCPR